MKRLTRFGVSIEHDLLSKFDKYISKKGYSNRSEALRDMIRDYLITEKIKNPNEEAIGTLTIVYDHHSGNLTNALLNIQHDHHNETLSTTHVHIDHTNCLEVIILKGKMRDIQHLANTIQSLKGVKHGELVITETTF
jgi:CopG family nickel-responsive transcriptional regulator